MKSFMDINEKMALYVFGCADLDVTVANLHGAASLITDSGIKFMLDRLAQKLGFFIFEDDGYMDLFYEIRLEVSQANSANPNSFFFVKHCIGFVFVVEDVG